jgi:hypothetical protein
MFSSSSSSESTIREQIISSKFNIFISESNEIIRQTCNIQDIADWITRRRHEWNEHITRMNPQRIVRQARDNHPRTRRSVGRPKKRWKDNL